MSGVSMALITVPVNVIGNFRRQCEITTNDLSSRKEIGWTTSII
jgi:hypothetical protein